MNRRNLSNRTGLPQRRSPGAGVAAVAVLVWLGFVCPCAVAQQVSEEQIEQSVWDSRYKTVDGQSVRARIVLSGQTGSYQTSSGRGRLSGIEYLPDLWDRGGVIGIRGKWAMGNSAGLFFFLVQSQTLKFEGHWGFGDDENDGGSWNGQFVSLAQQGGDVSYGPWQYNGQKRYYYRKCSFPAGGYQYLIYYKTRKPDWVYWYNPGKQVFWCACPTAKHPKWGEDIRNGKDLFLVASTKAREVDDCEFPDPGNDGANFTKGKTKDRDGSDVALGCPPADLP